VKKHKNIYQPKTISVEDGQELIHYLSF